MKAFATLERNERYLDPDTICSVAVAETFGNDVTKERARMFIEAMIEPHIALYVKFNPREAKRFDSILAKVLNTVPMDEETRIILSTIRTAILSEFTSFASAKSLAGGE